jgi:hypothetical protein
VEVGKTLTEDRPGTDQKVRVAAPAQRPDQLDRTRRRQRQLDGSETGFDQAIDRGFGIPPGAQPENRNHPQRKQLADIRTFLHVIMAPGSDPGRGAGC